MSKDFNKCYLCGKHTHTDVHHVFNGALRKKSEQYGATINLCRTCHSNVHNNAKLRMELKAKFQKIIMEKYNWDLEKWLKEFYANYRED